jgi:hypothetical protein
MKTYIVTTYQDKATYTVTLDDTGVVSATELSDSAIEQLKSSVSRLMNRYNLSPVTALDRVIGSYSTLTEQTDSAVAETPAEDVVP